MIARVQIPENHTGLEVSTDELLEAILARRGAARSPSEADRAIDALARFAIQQQKRIEQLEDGATAARPQPAKPKKKKKKARRKKRPDDYMLPKVKDYQPKGLPGAVLTTLREDGAAWTTAELVDHIRRNELTGSQVTVNTVSIALRNLMLRQLVSRKQLPGTPVRYAWSAVGEVAA